MIWVLYTRASLFPFIYLWLPKTKFRGNALITSNLSWHVISVSVEYIFRLLIRHTVNTTVLGLMSTQITKHNTTRDISKTSRCVKKEVS